MVAERQTEIISVRMPRTMYERMKLVAELMYMTPSDLIRESVEERVKTALSDPNFRDIVKAHFESKIDALYREEEKQIDAWSPPVT